MGWTGHFGEAPHTTEQYREVIQREEFGEKFRIIDFAKRGAVCYAAVQHPEGYVFGAVCLTRKSNDRWHGRTFMVKAMSEASGPYYYDCPHRIIRKLTPVDKLPHAGYAAEWREKCLNRGA